MILAFQPFYFLIQHALSDTEIYTSIPIIVNFLQENIIGQPLGTDRNGEMGITVYCEQSVILMRVYRKEDKTFLFVCSTKEYEPKYIKRYIKEFLIKGEQSPGGILINRKI